MDTKKAIAKLVKIAEAQQKIINKLAQQMQGAGAEQMGGSTSGWDETSMEVAPYVDAAASQVQAQNRYSVEHASNNKGYLDIRLKYPAAVAGSPEVRAVRDALTKLITGKQIAGVPVTTVNIIGVTA